MKKLRIILSAMLFGALAGLAPPGSADDTEIYLKQVTSIDESVRPNILFILDNSGSMLYDAGSSAPGKKRIDILKEVLVQVLDESHNINVGLVPTPTNSSPPWERGHPARERVGSPRSRIGWLKNNWPGRSLATPEATDSMARKKGGTNL